MRFYMRYVEQDSSGYYYTRWDRATQIQIIADSKKEAIEKMLKVIGEPRRHDKWGYTIDKIVDES